MWVRRKVGAARVRRCAPRLWKPAAPAAHARGASERRCGCAPAASDSPTTPENTKERDLGRVVAGLHAQHRTGHLNRETLRTMVPGSRGWRAARGIRERLRCAGRRLCANEGRRNPNRLLCVPIVVNVVSVDRILLGFGRRISPRHSICSQLHRTGRPASGSGGPEEHFGHLEYWRQDQRGLAGMAAAEGSMTNARIAAAGKNR